MPASSKWFENLPITSTPKGVRFDLRFYVYPDGHGNIVYHGDGNQGANGVDEAMEILRAVWEKAQDTATYEAN